MEHQGFRFVLSSLPRRHPRNAAIFAVLLSLGCLFSRRVEAQPRGTCRADRAVSTPVRAGLSAAAGAIPATVVRRYDQVSSHVIVTAPMAPAALIGFVAAGRDRPCVSRTDSFQVADSVAAVRTGRARRGALAGAVIGAALGAVGSTLYNVDVDCAPGPCRATRGRASLMLFSAGGGALAGGILGGLIGWAWPMGR